MLIIILMLFTANLTKALLTCLVEILADIQSVFEALLHHCGNDLIVGLDPIVSCTINWINRYQLNNSKGFGSIYPQKTT